MAGATGPSCNRLCGAELLTFPSTLGTGAPQLRNIEGLGYMGSQLSGHRLLHKKS